MVVTELGVGGDHETGVKLGRTPNLDVGSRDAALASQKRHDEDV
jgi:hypothetical protein